LAAAAADSPVDILLCPADDFSRRELSPSAAFFELPNAPDWARLAWATQTVDVTLESELH
jgi:hypothetical protein